MKKRIKRLATRASAALITLTLTLGTVSMPVYAGGGEEDTGAEWTEDVPVTVVPDSEPVVEEPEPEPLPPLTPDGNMTLVDDIEEVTEHNKQFITVVTKNGNYFYIIIDRDDEGENTVHFLNQVDEADLLSLMEEEEAAQYRPAEPEVVVEEEPEPEVEEPVEEEPPKKGKGATLLLLVLLLLAGGGGAYFYFFIWKKKKDNEEPATDPDAAYNEEDDDGIDFPVEEDIGDEDEEYLDEDDEDAEDAESELEMIDLDDDN
ncbi:MAG: DUF4366 domain-containing protein [Lachnospiraceae bacterium]|nr:DUF4366 domain-containing protein [Lachnospiraceae bacterium]